jgi:hypothetical protein
VAADYNRKVRISCALVLAAALALSGCHKSNASKDAVRQAVIDYVGGRGLNVAAMNIEVTAVNLLAVVAKPTSPSLPRAK